MARCPHLDYPEPRFDPLPKSQAGKPGLLPHRLSRYAGSPRCVKAPRPWPRPRSATITTPVAASPHPGRLVAHYFKFRSVEELAAAAGQLGLDLRFSDDLGPLFRPVKVGPRVAG